jgi:hypothetical protein
LAVAKFGLKSAVLNGLDDGALCRDVAFRRAGDLAQHGLQGRHPPDLAALAQGEETACFRLDERLGPLGVAVPTLHQRGKQKAARTGYRRGKSLRRNLLWSFLQFLCMMFIMLVLLFRSVGQGW